MALKQIRHTCTVCDSVKLRHTHTEIVIQIVILFPILWDAVSWRYNFRYKICASNLRTSGSHLICDDFLCFNLTYIILCVSLDLSLLETTKISSLSIWSLPPLHTCIFIHFLFASKFSLENYSLIKYDFFFSLFKSHCRHLKFEIFIIQPFSLHLFSFFQIRSSNTGSSTSFN